MPLRKDFAKAGPSAVRRVADLSVGEAGQAYEPLPTRAGTRTDGMLTPASNLTAGSRKQLKISTVSHTLDATIAERLRHFAFRERISESAVIEFALRGFFDSGEDPALGKRLRDAGAALRRKS